MLPAGVDTIKPSPINFFNNIFLFNLISRETVCLLCRNSDNSLIASSFFDERFFLI